MSGPSAKSWPVMSLAEADARLNAPGSPFEWEEIDIRTHAYAYSAIAIGRLTQAASYAQKPADGQFRVTAIAIGQGTTWHLAGAHYSPIAAR